MKLQTIQHPERYEAPDFKVKVLRKRAVLTASPSGENPEGNLTNLDDRVDG